MERAAGAARIGNQILGFFAAILILLLLMYGGYSLYDTYMTYQGARLGSDILRYKPTATEDNSPTFAELRNINKDVEAWLTIDGTHIDYPVLQGEDDMEYVNKDVYGKFSLSGAIFLSAGNKPDFSDSYNLVYGHHMEHGEMFGDVMEFLDQDYFDGHATGTLVTPEKNLHISIYAVVEADAYCPMVYHLDQINGDMDAFQQYIRENATHYRDIGITGADRVIALSTCVDAQTNGRAIVFGRLEETEQSVEGTQT